MRIVIFLVILSCSVANAESTVSSSGNFGTQLFLFQNKPIYPGQEDRDNISLFFEPTWSWYGEADSVVIRPFILLDRNDDNRNRFDLREMHWSYVQNEWEVLFGINRVFWGVTEFQHLVDILNQTDSVVSLSSEEKFGQLMFHYSLSKSWGVIDFYVLPGFRERSYASSSGRLRQQYVVNVDSPLYESREGKDHVDLALRWSSSIGIVDVGGYLFSGTSREPILKISADNEIIPFYEIVNQVGLDIQSTSESVLWKFEYVFTDGFNGKSWASQSGFEYTLSDISGSGRDLGLLMEYGYAEERRTLFQDDLFAGARVAFNDISNSQLLFGYGYDLENSSKSYLIEGSKRVGNAWKISSELRVFSGDDPLDPVSQLSTDDYLQITIQHFF